MLTTSVSTVNRSGLLRKCGIAVALGLLLPVSAMAGSSQANAATACKGAAQNATQKVAPSGNFSLQNVSDEDLMREMMRRMNSRRAAAPVNYRRAPAVIPAAVPGCAYPSCSAPAIAVPAPFFADPDQAMQMFAQEMARMHQQMMMLLRQQAPPAFMAPPAITMGWSRMPTPGMADVKFYSVESKPDKIVVKLKLPSGADQSMIKAVIKNNILQVTGKMERVTETKDAKQNIFMKSQSVENFQRALMLPKDIIASKMTTKSENGFFTITIPRKAAKK